jgi:hypothetical protein
MTRARFENALRAAVDEGAPRLGRCHGVTLPSALSWTKGAVAWELGVPLRRVRGIRTSVPHYLERLSEPGDEPLPSVPRGETVTVGSGHPSFALLDPFGGARVRATGPARVHLATVAHSGPWRVEVPEGGACGPGPAPVRRSYL